MSVYWNCGIKPSEIYKIDEVHALNMDEIRDRSRATHRVMIYDRNFEQVTPIGWGTVESFETNWAFGQPDGTVVDPHAQNNITRRSLPYVMKTNCVLVEPNQTMSGRFDPYYREGEMRRRTICCEYEQNAGYTQCRNLGCPYRYAVPGARGYLMPVEFIGMHQERPLIMGYTARRRQDSS